MLKKFVVAIPTAASENYNAPVVITREQSDPFKYEPVTDFDDESDAEKTRKLIAEIGIDAYLQRVLDESMKA